MLQHLTGLEAFVFLDTVHLAELVNRHTTALGNGIERIALLYLVAFCLLAALLVTLLAIARSCFAGGRHGSLIVLNHFRLLTFLLHGIVLRIALGH